MRRTVGAAAMALGLWLAATGAVAAADAAVQSASRGLLDQARTATERRDHDAALRAYAQLLSQRPADVDLLIEAARVNGFADRNADSARLYRQALALAPQRRADIVPSLAWQSLWSGAAADAEVLFTELSAAPGAARVDALDGLGQARQARGDQAGALLAFRQAHALAPDSLRLQRRLAMSLLWNGFEDQAITELQALLRREPGDRDLAWALANARNFAGNHRAALRDFLRQSAPVHPGERADLARAWRWAGYEDRAWPLLAGATDAEAVWLRDWRVWRELAPFGYATVERAEDRDALVARAAVLGGGWHPAPGSTFDVQLRRLSLVDPLGDPRATQLQASYRWRLGQATDAAGTFWPSVALRAHHFDDWSPVTASARVTWVPHDRWRVDAEATRELVETPRAVANRVTVDVVSAGVEHRPDAQWLLAGAVALLRFDDGNARLRMNGRVERRLWSRPHVALGLEASGFDRVETATVHERGYWNPRRYAEARVYTTVSHEMRPFDLQAKLALGASSETDNAGNVSHGHPHLWELGLGWDASPGLRLRLALGGAGQGAGLGGGGSGYWRRYVNLSLNIWH